MCGPPPPKNQQRGRENSKSGGEGKRAPPPTKKTPRRGGAPPPPGARHALIVARDACRLYELYALYPPKPGKTAWRAGSGAIWSLNSNHLRPKTWTSADAAGLPILPGLARYEDLKHGGIDHALRFTVSRTRRAFIYPARHYASDLTDSRLPRMGERLRLKAGYDISRF